MVANETHGESIRGGAEYVIFDKLDDADGEVSSYELSHEIETEGAHHASRFQLDPIPTHDQPYAGRAAPGAQAQSINSLRSLSRGGLVPISEQPQLLLPRHALAELEFRERQSIADVRRPGYGPAGTGHAHQQRVEQPNRNRKPTKTQRRERTLRGEFICGTLGGPHATPRNISREAAPFRRARADIKAPVMHYSLSLEKADRVKTKEQWEAMVTRFLELMDYPRDGPYFCYRHSDKEGMDHVHIMWLRSLGDGTVWSREFSAKRAIRATAQIEIEFGLRQHDRTPKDKKRLTRKEQELDQKLNKEGKELSKTIIQEAVDSAVKKLAANGGTYSLQQLQAELMSSGVEARPYAPGGKLKGLSYTHAGIPVSASALGSRYSPNGLFQRGLLDLPVEVPAADPEAHFPTANELADPLPALLAEFDQLKRQIDISRTPEEGLKAARAMAEFFKRTRAVGLRDALDKALADRQAPRPIQPASTIADLLAVPERVQIASPVPEPESEQEEDAHGLALHQIAELMAAAVQAGIEAVRVVIELVRRLVNRLLGRAEQRHGLNEGALGRISQHFQCVGVPRTPRNSAEARARAEASVQLDQIHEALASEDAELLPEVEGKAEVLAAVQAGRQQPVHAQDRAPDLFDSDGNKLGPRGRLDALRCDLARAQAKGGDSAEIERLQRWVVQAETEFVEWSKARGKQAHSVVQAHPERQRQGGAA